MFFAGFYVFINNYKRIINIYFINVYLTINNYFIHSIINQSN